MDSTYQKRQKTYQEKKEVIFVYYFKFLKEMFAFV